MEGRFIADKSKIRNCRCCMASYVKSSDDSDCDDYWCQVSVADENGKPLEPVGFCDSCDRNNSRMYIPTKKCHK